MTTLPEYPFQIIVFGLPGTLKTFLSSRIAHRLGAVWLPTVSLGPVTTQPGAELNIQRAERYGRCVDALRVLGRMRVRVVVDGGFSSFEIKRDLFAAYPECPKVLIECWAPDESRLAHLRLRSQDMLDVERESAKSVLEYWQSNQARSNSTHQINLHTLTEIGCATLIRIDTSTFTVKVEGALEESMRENIFSALSNAFDEFRSTDKSHARVAITQNFDELAPRYEESTEWRTDATLLGQLRVDLPKRAGDVLDIGSGTGLASQWYTEQGHRCIGVDLSPQMSVRAAPRVLFTAFGSALDLPFFDASFDLVLMRQMLHYTEPALALQESFRVVRPGGFLVVAAAVAPSDEIKPIWEEFKNVTQPLRLRVFSQTDLTRLAEQAGFTLVETRHGSLVRSESFEQLDRRATAPSSGWASFLNTMEKIFADLAPQLEFKVDEHMFAYRQYWVTLVAQKPFLNQT